MADVVEAVRCKDCEHSTKSMVAPSYDEKQYLCWKKDEYHKADDTCSFANRKEGVEYDNTMQN